MTAKQYLQRVRRCRIETEQLKEELHLVRLECTGRGLDYSGDPIKSGGVSDPTLQHIIRIDSLERELEKKLGTLQTIRHSIIEKIQAMDDDRYVQVLFKRYVEEKPFEVIATEMHYDYKWTCKLHGFALKELYDTYLNTTKDE